jgi:hypothetical protein
VPVVSVAVPMFLPLLVLPPLALVHDHLAQLHVPLRPVPVTPPPPVSIAVRHVDLLHHDDLTNRFLVDDDRRRLPDDDVPSDRAALNYHPRVNGRCAEGRRPEGFSRLKRIHTDTVMAAINRFSSHSSPPDALSKGLSMLTRSLALATLITLAGCASPSRNAQHERAGMQAALLIPAMSRHLDSVAATPAMLHQGLSDHAQRVHELMAAMHADMMRMGVHSDSAYEALADSTVSDLKLMERASGAEYDRLAAAHIQHVRRLMAAYDSKTGQGQ